MILLFKTMNSPRAFLGPALLSIYSLSFITIVSLACARQIASPGSEEYGAPSNLAELENKSIKESSGIAASRRDAKVLWTHNDSGDGPFVYAFDRAGKHLGTWRLAGADAQDWEDMAIGPGPIKAQSYLYLGDIGDNSRKRDHIVVYRVQEPSIDSKDSSSTNQNPINTSTADVIRLKYPDGPRDAETLMVHPSTGDLYVVSKQRGAAAGVYKLKAPFPKSGAATLERVGEVRFPNIFMGFLTGGDISPDGRRVILCDYLGACELSLPAGRNVPFDEIWKQPVVSVEIGKRRQGEAICYRSDGLALLATSEGSPCPLIEIVRATAKK